MDSKQSLDQGILPGFVCEEPAGGGRFEEEVEEACGPESHSETSRAKYFLRCFGHKYQVLRDASIIEFSRDNLWRKKDTANMPSVIQFLMSEHFAVLMRISAAKVAAAERNGMNKEEVKLLKVKFNCSRWGQSNMGLAERMQYSLEPCAYKASRENTANEVRGKARHGSQLVPLQERNKGRVWGCRQRIWLGGQLEDWTMSRTHCSIHVDL